LVDAFEAKVAPHNFNDHLGSLIGARMYAAIPNFRILEIAIDEIRLKDRNRDDPADYRKR
jgi:hypothetical protein